MVRAVQLGVMGHRKQAPAGTLIAPVLLLPSAFSLNNLLYFILVSVLARLLSSVAYEEMALTPCHIRYDVSAKRNPKIWWIEPKDNRNILDSLRDDHVI